MRGRKVHFLRRLLCEPLESRRLLAGNFGPTSDFASPEDAGAWDSATVPTSRLEPAVPPVLTVDAIVSDATREALQLEGGPHGLVQLGDGEMLRLASGPAPSELLIRTPFNVNAADTTNTDQLQAGGALGLNLTGSGYTVGVWDAGLIRNTHQEFGSRVTLADSGSFHYHSTHVGGTIGASGVVAGAEGMATQVALRSREWTNDLAEMNSDAGLIDVSNHSYGYVTGWAIYPASDYGFSTPSGAVDVWFEDRYLYAAEDTDFGKYSSEARDLDVVLAGQSRLAQRLGGEQRPRRCVHERFREWNLRGVVLGRSRRHRLVGGGLVFGVEFVVSRAGRRRQCRHRLRQHRRRANCQECPGGRGRQRRAQRSLYLGPDRHHRLFQLRADGRWPDQAGRRRQRCRSVLDRLRFGCRLHDLVGHVDGVAQRGRHGGAVDRALRGRIPYLAA